MILPLLIAAALQTAPAGQALPAAPTAPAGDRYHQCLELATSRPADAVTAANDWQLTGGGFVALQCLGIAYANQNRWSDAATAFEAAAHDAEAAKDARSASYHAQAGNAWLAAGDAAKARTALDAALASGTLDGLQRGEAQLDRSRALVAAGSLEAARTDIDSALETATDDPLAWLLSATLARRTNDLARAHHDIAEALKRAADDASVQLEAGNIAALSGDEAGAKAAWTEAARLSPDSPAAAHAHEALAQFDEAPQR